MDIKKLQRLAGIKPEVITENPLAALAGGAARAAVGSAVRGVVGDLVDEDDDAITENPLSALAGAVGSAVGGAADAVGSVVGGAADAVGSVVGGAADAVGNLVGEDGDAMRGSVGMDMDSFVGDDMGVESQLITAMTLDKAEYIVDILDGFDIDAYVASKQGGGYYVKFYGTNADKEDAMDVYASLHATTESMGDDIDADERMQTMMDDEHTEEELLLPNGAAGGEYNTTDVGFGEEDSDDFDAANAAAYPEYDMPSDSHEDDDGVDLARMQQLAGIRESDKEEPVDILPWDYETDDDEDQVEEAYDDQQVLSSQYSVETPDEEGFPHGADSSLDHRLIGMIGGKYGDTPRLKRESVEANRLLKLAGLKGRVMVSESASKSNSKVVPGSINDIRLKLEEDFRRFCEDTIAMCANPAGKEESGEDVEMEEGIDKPMDLKKAQARRALQIRKWDAEAKERKAREAQPEYAPKKKEVSETRPKQGK